jgi:hypothetical protein
MSVSMGQVGILAESWRDRGGLQLYTIQGDLDLVIDGPCR